MAARKKPCGCKDVAAIAKASAEMQMRHARRSTGPLIRTSAKLEPDPTPADRPRRVRVRQGVN